MDRRSAEPIRLVVWDLDETFWKGTLTEGGITFSPENRDIVIALAERGIMSTICSKNDFEPVRDILMKQDVWDFFIFPSVNWEPKGPRLQALIEIIQLRPETVLLIDDNPMNRNEALFFVPGIQVADETVIPQLLSNPLCKGKDDRALTRLQQYKLLEKRKADEIAAGGSNVEFLRSSNIRIQVDHDIESQIDRVIELINRTNQLNFTKLRLPEDRAAAEAEVRQLASAYDVQAGLIRVRDNYGDYGFCGFFALKTSVHGEKRRLLHYCFSCRILNMGVEAFVYQMLGRPSLAVEGEVLSDPATADPVDWITVAGDNEAEEAHPKDAPPFFLRGGCELAAVEHYARMVSPDVRGEYNFVRDGIDFRTNHSLLIRYAIDGLPEGAEDAVYRLGYVPEDFQSALFSDPRPGCWILNVLPDQWVAVYRHNATGALIPFVVAPDKGQPNACELTDAQRRELADNPRALTALETLADEFSYVGRLPETICKANLDAILRAIPEGSKIFIVLNKEYYGSDDIPQMHVASAIRLNGWIRDVAGDYPNVTCVLITDFLESAADATTQSHFHRMVYYRIFTHIYRAASGSEPAVAQKGTAKPDATHDELHKQARVLDGAIATAPVAARVEAARGATEAKEWPRAAELWDGLRREFPKERLYWHRSGAAYCEAGLFQKAAPLLTEAIDRFPDDSGIAYYHIQVARQQGDWDEALRRSERLRQKLPQDWRGWVASADALAALGRDGEALCRYRDAVERFPNEFWPNFGLAWFTARQSGGNDAVRTWSELVDRFPGKQPALMALDNARRAAVWQAADAGPAGKNRLHL
jgi:FkbH-like protein